MGVIKVLLFYISSNSDLLFVEWIGICCGVLLIIKMVLWS